MIPFPFQSGGLGRNRLASGGGLGPAPNPTFSNVALLLHCDGTDASTTFTDSGPAARAVTASGNAQIDTAESKFGGASALFDGVDDYLSLPDTAIFDFGANNFCVEFWMRKSASNTMSMIAKRSSTASSSGWTVNVTNTGALNFAATSNGASMNLQMTSAGGLVSNSVWYHVAVTRNGSAWNIWLDGVSVASLSSASSIQANINTLRIGVGGDNNGSDYTGWLDDIRITAGEPVYTTAFIPPASAFPDS